MHIPLRVGLTGGIGSGKSTVASLFAEKNVPVVDADAIAHQLTQPGSPVSQDIIATFGTAVATPDNAIDRRALAKMVFSSPTKRAKLEQILHPHVREELERSLQAISAPYCILVIPLLIEVGWQELVDRVLVVDVDETTQIQRTCARDQRDAEAVRAIMGSQVTRAIRLKSADDIIHNDSGLEILRGQVDVLHRKYLALAKAQANV